MNDSFICDQCQKTVQTHAGTGGTGCAINAKGDQICYACCADNDRERMTREGKITLYFHGNKLTNWPGTLTFEARNVRTGKAGGFRGSIRRTSFRFTGPDDKEWYGYQQGAFNELAHCRRLK